jgi:hypothetical protein
MPLASFQQPSRCRPGMRRGAGGLLFPRTGSVIGQFERERANEQHRHMYLADDYAWLERAAIIEFDGRLTREEAERSASLWFGERVRPAGTV